MSELPNFAGRLKPVDWAKPFVYSEAMKAQLKSHADPKCRICSGSGITLNQRGDESACLCVHQSIVSDLE